MGYIELSSQKTTETEPLSNKQELADGDIDRVAYWGAKTFFPNGVVVPGTPEVPAVLDEQGNVVTPAVPAVPDSVRLPTGAEVFHAITDAVYAQIKRDVEALYLREAEAEARASVQPIVLTPAA